MSPRKDAANGRLVPVSGCLLALILMACNNNKIIEKPDPVRAEKIMVGGYRVDAIDYYTAGVHYKIFRGDYGACEIINITKDSTEAVLNDR